MRVDSHIDVPLVGFEELKVEAGSDGRDAHVELCVRETGIEKKMLAWASRVVARVILTG